MPERDIILRALYKLESVDPDLRAECDRIFSFFYENERRNVHAVALKFYLSPSSVYRRLDILCDFVLRELALKEKNLRIPLCRS